MSAEKLIEQADAYIKSVDVNDLHPDVQSLVATYRARTKAEDKRGMVAFARAIVRRAKLSGHDPASKAIADMLLDELRAEIDRRNEGRADADLIVPDGTKKAELLAALEADDARE